MLLLLDAQENKIYCFLSCSILIRGLDPLWTK